MKVLHIEDRFHPGMGYQINFFARYRSHHYEFIIVTSSSTRLWEVSGEGTDLERLDRQFEEEHQVKIIRLPSALDRRSKNNLWIKGLIKTIRKIDPDIVYAHTIESYSSLRIALSGKVLPRYRTYFDTHTLLNQFGGGLSFRLHLMLLRMVVRGRVHKHGARVFGTVPENLMILEKKYGIRNERILYSPIGTDLSVFRFDPEGRKELRKQVEVDEHTAVCLYTGKINIRKKPHLILQAVRRMETRIRHPLQLVFLGAADHPYMDQYMDTGFSSEMIRVKILPAVPVTDLYRWYSMADFAVFPRENTLSALDAQACRLPVVMASDLTNDERLKEGGLTYEKENLEDLAEKILWMAGNPEQRREMGAGGEAHVRGKYDYRKIVRQMEEDLGLFAW